MTSADESSSVFRAPREEGGQGRRGRFIAPSLQSGGNSEEVWSQELLRPDREKEQGNVAVCGVART